MAAAAAVGDVSDIASTVGASLGALVAVLGYDLYRVAREEPHRVRPDPEPAAAVITTSVLAFLGVALGDWSVRAAFDPPTVLAVLLAAGTALAGVAVLRRASLGGRQ